MKKIISVILALALLTILAVPAFAEPDPDSIADDAVMYKLDMDNYSFLVTYEDAYAGDEWMNSVDDLGLRNEVSFIGDKSRAIIVEREEAISGEQSLRAKGHLDSREWNISLNDGNGDYIFYEYKIKILSLGTPGSSIFYTCITEPDYLDDTLNAGPGGKLAEIRCGEETAYVVNREEEVIYTFPTINEVYKVACAIPLGGNTFDLFINGVRVSENNPFVCEVNNITAARWDLRGNTSDREAIAKDPREIVIDDIILTVGNYITKAEYFATPEPTPEPTATPEPTNTPEPTDIPVRPTDDPSKKDKGCGNVLVSSAAVIAVTLLGSAIVLRKKH